MYSFPHSVTFCHTRAGRRWPAPLLIPSCCQLMFFSTGFMHLAPRVLSTHHGTVPIWLPAPDLTLIRYARQWIHSPREGVLRPWDPLSARAPARKQSTNVSSSLGNRSAGFAARIRDNQPRAGQAAQGATQALQTGRHFPESPGGNHTFPIALFMKPLWLSFEPDPRNDISGKRKGRAQEIWTSSEQIQWFKMLS